MRSSVRGGFVFRARLVAAVAGALLALTLLWSSASVAGTRTTQPGKHVLVYFILSDNKISYAIYRKTLGSGANDLLFLEKWVVRGDFATFFVINRGTKPHGFAFLGKKWAALKPGQKTHFYRALLIRGGFPYRSTTDPGKAFKGVFPVY
jgi:hypothetical protein